MNTIQIPPTLLFQEALNQHILAQCALFLAILLLWTIVCGKVLKLLLGLPTIAGHIIAGILLGPSLLNFPAWQFFAYPLRLISYDNNTIYTLASSDLFVAVIFVVSAVLTVPYLLWMAGYETDLRDMMQVGLPALLAGVLGAVLPVFFVVGILCLFFSPVWSLTQALGMGLAFAATSVSIPVAMLFSYHKMHLKSSQATLGAAVIDDIIAVILLSLFMICVNAGLLGKVKAIIPHTSDISIVGALGAIVGVLGLVGLLGYTLIPSVLRWLNTLKIIHLIAPVATIIMLLAFSFVELAGGLAGITGAYFAGLFHRMGDNNHSAQAVIAPFVTTILLPLFLGSIGFQINMQLLSLYDWLLVLLLLVLAVISKLMGCWIATAIANVAAKKKDAQWTLWETYLFGSSMVARGEVGLVVTTILYGAHIFNAQQYAIAVAVIVLTTVAAPVMLAIGFKYMLVEPIDQNSRLVLNASLFPTLGITRLFHIIVDGIPATGHFNMVTHIDEGREVVTLEGERVKVILCPEEGIVFEGDVAKITTTVDAVKKVIAQELERISMPI